MSIAENIRSKLEAALAPAHVAVDDESALHAGHAGARPGGETHFRVRIVSAAFAGMNRVERQRRVHEILADEFRTRIHALSIDARTPEEARTK